VRVSVGNQINQGPDTPSTSPHFSNHFESHNYPSTLPGNPPSSVGMVTVVTLSAKSLPEAPKLAFLGQLRCLLCHGRCRCGSNYLACKVSGTPNIIAPCCLDFSTSVQARWFSIAALFGMFGIVRSWDRSLSGSSGCGRSWPQALRRAPGGTILALLCEHEPPYDQLLGAYVLF